MPECRYTCKELILTSSSSGTYPQANTKEEAKHSLSSESTRDTKTENPSDLQSQDFVLDQIARRQMLSFESFVADREPVSVALGGTKEEEVATGSQGLLRFFC